MTEYGRIHTDGSRSGGQPVLLPCPFCGGSDLFVDTIDGSLPPQTGQTIWCEDCTAKASYGDWNTRQPAQSDALREVVIEECAKALEADAKKCDCAALEANECACGAWDDYKSITSTRAVEIVLALKGKEQ